MVMMAMVVVMRMLAFVMVLAMMMLALMVARLMVIIGARFMARLAYGRLRLGGWVGDRLDIVPAMVIALSGCLCQCRRRESGEEK